jgi:hypothetical protein
MKNGRYPSGVSKRRARIRWWIERIVLAVLATSVFSYLADLAVFTMREKPLGQVNVDSYMAVPLKGSKTEYDYEGTLSTACSESLFPQGEWTPCWYLRRHPHHADQY